jgi:hypothetical protein
MNKFRQWFPYFCLAASLVQVCVIAGSGCASSRPEAEAPASWHSSGFHPTAPGAFFSDYEAAFKYIAACEGLPRDSRTILEIAADSTVERSHPEPIGTLLVIRAEYYGLSRFGIRGAQGNGRYYALQSVESQWRLVGIFHANRLRWESVGGAIQVVAHWHGSGDEGEPTVYTWKNGRFE